MSNSTQGNKTLPQMTPIAAITTGMLFHCWDPTQPVGSRDGAFPVNLLLNTSFPQSANVVFAGPTSGAAAAPSFRSLVAADLPTVPVSKGGTGLATLQANSVLIGEGTSNVNMVGPGTSGQPLVSNGAGVDPAFGTAGVNGGGTGRSSIIANTVLAGNGSSAIAQIGPGTSGQMLLGVTGSFPNFGNNPTITGGTIDNAVIGGSTPVAANFTTVGASGLITPSSTNGIKGTTTNDNANAGSIGEYVTANATGVSLSSGVTANVTSISLTAGDWDVSGSVVYNPTTNMQAGTDGISTTSATFGSEFNNGRINFGSALAGAVASLPTPNVRLSLASTTTVFLVASASFSAGTMTADGLIRARRVR